MVKLPEFLQLKPVWRNTTLRLHGPITATSNSVTH
jgi:hypothetical protein